MLSPSQFRARKNLVEALGLQNLLSCSGINRPYPCSTYAGPLPDRTTQFEE